MFLPLRQGHTRSAAFHSRITCDNPRVDAIGFLQHPHALGKIPHCSRIQYAHRHTLSPQQRERLFFISTGSFQRHQLYFMLPAKSCQFRDPFRIVSKRTPWPSRLHKGFQGSRTNIHSTNDSRHGNLPCTCDRWSGDCSVVRDCGGGPRCSTTVVQPEGSRVPPPRKRLANLESLTATSHHNLPPLSRYKGSLFVCK